MDTCQFNIREPNTIREAIEKIVCKYKEIGTPEELATWLPSFFNEIAVMMAAEHQWAPQVFPGETDILSRLLQEVGENLHEQEKKINADHINILKLNALSSTAASTL